MAASPPAQTRRRPRRGSLERPVNARMVRGTWPLLGLPLLLLAFSFSRPEPLPPPALPSTFDAETTLALADALASDHPDRSPGTGGSLGARTWVTERFQLYGLEVRQQVFEAEIPGRGTQQLTNLIGVVPGTVPDAPALVVMAHRDNAGLTRGANDNASGTAALIELARPYARLPGTAGGVSPAHTIVFLSTDGGAFGGLGAARFAATSPYTDRITAVVNLDTIGGGGPARIELAGDRPRSTSATLLRTAAERLIEQTGVPADRPGAAQQLVDLGFPFSLYEHAPFVARGIPALTLTTSGPRPVPAHADAPGTLDPTRMAEIGAAAQGLLASLDQGLELPGGGSSFVWLETRLVQGWAIQLVLLAALLPFLAAVVDLFARCRRRRIPLAPALRSLRSRGAFWLYVGVLFALTSLVGAWPSGAARPPAPELAAAPDWPVVTLAVCALLAGLGWIVARDRLLPRREVTPVEELAGYTTALVALGTIALVVTALNPFALIFLLPSAHAWLWLPQLAGRHPAARAGVFLIGLAGPAVLLLFFAARLGAGADALWYLATLVSLRYVDVSAVLVTLAWLAVAAQLAALAAGRYAPYPTAAERPPLGPIRTVLRRLLVGVPARRPGAEEEIHAAEGS